MSLDKYREAIDNIDDEILDLLNKRAEHVKSIGEIKKSSNSSIWVPSRELSIYERLIKNNEGRLFPTSAIKPIFREIISASLALEKELKIGYLGPTGTYSNLAAIKHFGSAATFVPTDNISDIFHGVKKSWFDYGIVPIENSIEGVINHTIDMFIDLDINIVGERYVEINHNLLSQTGDIKDIKSICSHPQALAQCRRYLSSKFVGIPIYETQSTAAAAKKAEEDISIAAIGSELSGIIYNLKAVDKSIQDMSSNHTRFLIIGRDSISKTGEDKTSLMFAVNNTAGSLYKALELLYKQNINMTKIESRPSKRKIWEYIFYVDLDGHKDDDNLKTTISEFSKKLPLFKVLGSYPKG